ncbi:hypothetical protein PABY_06910 [Pyrodictium abyssi]|uniref:Uncharacterized protein n=1 Tax=Pyrodictium abyssi TaxID=54256 RepID=A0ABM8IUA5_9CREN|nr:hypothetical protein PABY_06910 [Pyrodictium abyssi]
MLGSMAVSRVPVLGYIGPGQDYISIWLCGAQHGAPGVEQTLPQRGPWPLGAPRGCSRPWTAVSASQLYWPLR